MVFPIKAFIKAFSGHKILMTIIYFKRKSDNKLIYCMFFTFGFKDLRFKLFHQKSKKRHFGDKYFLYYIDEVLRFKDLLTCS